METLKKNKGMLGAAVFLILAVYLYHTFFGSTDVAITELPAPGAESGYDLVQIGSKLSNISFNRDFLKTPAYRSLIDFSTPLFSQPAGRPNPFNAIGRD